MSTHATLATVNKQAFAKNKMLCNLTLLLRHEYL